MEPPDNRLLRPGRRRRALERVRHDRLRDGQQVLRTVLQLPDQNRLTRLGLLSLRHIPGDGMDPGWLVVFVSDELGIDLQRQALTTLAEDLHLVCRLLLENKK